MRRRNRAPVAGLLAVACAWAAGCGPRYWVPNREQMADAQEIAKLYVLQHVGDQAGAAEVMSLTNTPGEGIAYPIVFTIGGTPYVRYRTKFWGAIEEGRKVIHVQYFDPVKIPDWDKGPNVTGVFPAYFDVVVDSAARDVLRVEKPAAADDAS